MARAYSDDLWRKVLSGYAAGKGTMRELAARFDVSYGWLRKRQPYKSPGPRTVAIDAA